MYNKIQSLHDSRRNSTWRVILLLSVVVVTGADVVVVAVVVTDVLPPVSGHVLQALAQATVIQSGLLLHSPDAAHV